MQEVMKKVKLICILISIFLFFVSCSNGDKNSTIVEDVQKENENTNEINTEDEEVISEKEESTKLESSYTVDMAEDKTVEILIEWDGTYNNGDLFDLAVTMSGTTDSGTAFKLNESISEIYDSNNNLIADFTKKLTKNKGSIKINVYDIEGKYSIWADDANFDPTDWENDIGMAQAVATVATPADEDALLYLEDGLIRSYTGVWFWGICGLDHGKLTEYDDSWVQDGYDSMNETVADETDNTKQEPTIISDTSNGTGEMQTWTITKYSTQLLTEYKEITYTKEWETGTVHTLLPRWDVNEDSGYLIMDFEVDMENRTVEIYMDCPEGSPYWKTLVIDLRDNTYYGTGYFCP